MFIHRLSIAAMLCCSCMAAGCRGWGEDRYPEMYSSDPSVRIDAIRRAGNSFDIAAAGHLIENLSHEDAFVRYWAHYALLLIYHGPGDKTYAPPFPYVPYADEPTRAPGVRKWEEWWKNEGKKRLAEREAGSPAKSK